MVSTNCRSAGEALRVIDQKDIIKADFVLVRGYTSLLQIASGPCSWKPTSAQPANLLSHGPCEAYVKSAKPLESHRLKTCDQAAETTQHSHTGR